MKAKWQKITKTKNLVLIGLVLVIAISAGVYVQGKSSSAVATPQQVVKAQRGDIVSLVSATGTVAPVNSVDISSKITAQIKEIKVNENDQVKAGQVLAVLEDTALKAQVTQDKARMDNAAVKYQRMSRLYSIGAASKEQFDDASMDYNIAKASYDQTMSNLNETVITAPIDGTVIGKPLTEGDMVAQGVNNPTVIMTVADMSKMQVQAQVDQTDIGKIALGQKVTFTVDAYPGTQFTGTVSLISRKPNVQQNVTYYQVTIDVSDTDNMLNPGMVARVSIVTSENKGVVTVPLAAVQTDKSGNKYVVVAGQNGQNRNVNVTVGSMTDDRVEITSGLNEGDSVLIAQPKAQAQTGSTQQGKSQGQGGQNPLNMMRRM